MLNTMKKWILNVTTRSLLLSVAILLVLTGCSIALSGGQSNDRGQHYDEATHSDSSESILKEAEPLTSFEDVAHYLREHQELPPNYITKDEARQLGWIAAEGNLHDVAPGMSIGGDRFGNREGLLPKAKNRQYYEADIDYEGGRRNANRIVYSNDGLIFMTIDHYKTFTDITKEGSVSNE